MLILGALLGLAFTLSGCSKSENTACCHDIFTSSSLLSQRQQQNSSNNGATLSQGDATASDGTSAKIAGSTNTVQDLDRDDDPLIYKIIDRATDGRVVVDPDTGTFTYTPSAAERALAAGLEERFDTFEVKVRDDFPIHLHGLPGLLDRFGDRDPH
jgi:hypothetical protein